MSLTRQRILGLCRRSVFTTPYVRTRQASSDSHHDHHEDPNVYPEESFNTPFWRNTVIVAIAGIAIYNIVPYFDRDGTYIARYIARYKTSSHVWADINSKHLEQSIQAAENQLLTTSALRSPVIRMRYPSSLDYASSRNVPVGSQVDFSDFVVKKDEPWA
ncbi:hypothetical protein BU17DRAFT_53615 [Hysterangium stoloniferum]|nr:hypothetical protein BU17DRAFT_53615 [Hysterangium stoloniferum]